eukprot:m.427052 g.427052  ORF g.427052 m.427052 type:complete len:924 (+) comp20226_c0_seq1:239-3010(+)
MASLPTTFSALHDESCTDDLEHVDPFAHLNALQQVRTTSVPVIHLQPPGDDGEGEPISSACSADAVMQSHSQPTLSGTDRKDSLTRSDSFNTALSSDFLDYLSLSSASRSAIQRTASTRASHKGGKTKGATAAARRAAAKSASAARSDEHDDAGAAEGLAVDSAAAATGVLPDSVSVHTLFETASSGGLGSSRVLAEDTKQVISQLDVLIARSGSKHGSGSMIVNRKESYAAAVSFNGLSLDGTELDLVSEQGDESLDWGNDSVDDNSISDLPTQKLSEGDLEHFCQVLKLNKEKLQKQSEANFLMERDLRQLDQRIGLLITHHKKKPTKSHVVEHLEEPSKRPVMSPRQIESYGSMMGILKSTPRYSAIIARNLLPVEVDDFMRTIMFTLYGSDYDSRDEHMLLSVFEHAMAMEFASCADLGSVMRSNTAVSRMMSTYVRRGLGQQYLKDVLEQQIRIVMQVEEALEVDPVKVKKELQKLEGQNGEVSDGQVEFLVQQRTERLRDLTEGFLDAIAISLPMVPFGVRWLCKTIKALTRKTFPAATQENYMSLIGGFYLLRFVNPAIVSPDAFGLIKTKLSPASRRNLLFVAKILQNIGNSTAFTKDSVAKLLADFVTEKQGQLHEFFDSLTEADDFHEEFKFENIAALAQPATTLSITTNELFSIHRLLVRSREHLGLTSEDPMTHLLDDMGEAPAKMSRADSRTVKVPLARLASNVDRPEDVDASMAEKRPVVSFEARQARLVSELERVQRALETLDDNYRFLKSKVDTYEAYLDNVRGQSTLKTNTLRTAFSTVDMLSDPKKAKTLKRQLIDVSKIEPARFKLSKLDKDGLVLSTSEELPPMGSPGRKEIVLSFAMLGSGNFQISIADGEDRELFSHSCKFEEILEKTEDSDPVLDLGSWMRLDAYATIELLDKTFSAHKH